VKQWLEERRFFQVAYYINLLFLFFVMDLCANLVS